MPSVDISKGKGSSDGKPQPPRARGVREVAVQLALESFKDPLLVKADEYRGVQQIGIRQTFRGNDGYLYFGKQGINIPQEDFLLVAMALLNAFNLVTGKQFSIHGGNEDEEIEIADVAEELGQVTVGDPERIYQWTR